MLSPRKIQVFCIFSVQLGVPSTSVLKKSTKALTIIFNTEVLGALMFKEGT